MKEIAKENLKPIIFIVIVLVLAAISAYPQRRLTGRVIEVVDGKTCVVMLPTGKLTAVLQYIEVPDPEQPLHQTVKAHLQSLVLDKDVEFMPRGVLLGKTVGRLYVKGVDVSQQMLRDGAAWYSVAERKGQNEPESVVYQENEQQAKAEKRGVWGIDGLVPVWEFRAQQAALGKRLEKDEFTRGSLVRKGPNERNAQIKAKQLNSESNLWAESETERLPAGVKNIGGLLISHDPSGKFGFVGTPSLKMEILGSKNAPTVNIGLAYFYGDDGAGGLRKSYVVGVESFSKDFSFLKNNNLIVTVGKQQINLGKARRVARRNDFGVREILTYYIKRDVIEKIADAASVKVKVGAYDAKINADIQQLLKNMLKST